MERWTARERERDRHRVRDGEMDSSRERERSTSCERWRDGQLERERERSTSCERWRDGQHERERDRHRATEIDTASEPRVVRLLKWRAAVCCPVPSIQTALSLSCKLRQAPEQIRQRDPSARSVV